MDITTRYPPTSYSLSYEQGEFKENASTREISDGSHWMYYVAGQLLVVINNKFPEWVSIGSYKVREVEEVAMQVRCRQQLG